jgi:hypothetical protein
LKQNCGDLLHDLERLADTLQQTESAIPDELHFFYQWVCAARDSYKKRANHILNLLDLNLDDILPDLLSEAETLLLDFQLFNRRLLGPVLRARKADRLSLMVLNYLHKTHPRAKDIPTALSDGDFASWPFPEWPAVYFMPPSAQHRLLYLPLFFHEFGHILYSCYKQEMDVMVKDLQSKIQQFLQPSAQRDDALARRDEQKRRAISETWYEWTHELFCDAVGFVIGGAAFANSFSMYFRLLGREEYHLRSEELERREHPVTWLRIRVLADRARRMGSGQIGTELEETWSKIAATMGVEEDYYGFFEDHFLSEIQKTIDEMLAQVELSSFQDQGGLFSSTERAEGNLITTPRAPFVTLLNQAWNRFLNNGGKEYASWERDAVDSLLMATETA